MTSAAPGGSAMVQYNQRLLSMMTTSRSLDLVKSKKVSSVPFTELHSLLGASHEVNLLFAYSYLIPNSPR
jgi:hypothetical protein